MKKFKMSKQHSKKNFKSGAKNVKTVNNAPRPQRGGIVL